MARSGRDEAASPLSRGEAGAACRLAGDSLLDVPVDADVTDLEFPEIHRMVAMRELINQGDAEACRELAIVKLHARIVLQRAPPRWVPEPQRATRS